MRATEEKNPVGQAELVEVPHGLDCLPLKCSTQLGLSVLDPHAGCRCVLYAKIGAFSLGRF